MIVHGDLRDALRGVPDAVFDACVCDPPYELAFMGRRWDASGIAYDVKAWAEILRVLKPGAHLLAFGGTRTYHRVACAIEDAGFDIRDSIDWIYGTGFPKSLDVSKAIDATAGAWAGWGTALKPAHEPIIVARKPLDGTVAANVLAHGTGAINVDVCRVGATHDAGRWPPNVLFSHAPECTADACAPGCPVAELGAQSGTTRAGRQTKPLGTGGIWSGESSTPCAAQYGDMGTAARFFPVFRYEAKASTREREAGCEALPAVTGAEMVDRTEGSAGTQSPRAGAGRTAASRRNTHPTVKPLALMRWLVRLVTPPGGVVLDPFAGSGTTGVACVREGFDFVGVELDAQHCAIAEARIAHARGARR